MLSEAKVTEIYCMADDFCREFIWVQGKYMVKDRNHKRRNKPRTMQFMATSAFFNQFPYLSSQSMPMKLRIKIE